MMGPHRTSWVRTVGFAGVVTFVVALCVWTQNFRVLRGRWQSPVSGWLVGFALAVGAVVLGVRTGRFSREDLALGPAPHFSCCARGFAESLVFARVVVALGIAADILRWDGALAEEALRAFRRGPWSYVTRLRLGPQPWSVFLLVPLEELLFRGLWLGVALRLGGSRLVANLTQAGLLALWHSLLTGQFQPEMALWGPLFGVVTLRRRSLAEAFGFHLGWDWDLGAAIGVFGVLVHEGVGA